MLETMFSNITCGLNCWIAEEEVCKCSCFGKNHSVLLSGQNPEKIIKIDGFKYKLINAGNFSNMYVKVRELIESKKEIKKTLHVNNRDYTYFFEYNDKGSPFRLKKATKSQKNWLEIKNLGLLHPYCIFERIEF